VVRFSIRSYSPFIESASEVSGCKSLTNGDLHLPKWRFSYLSPSPEKRVAETEFRQSSFNHTHLTLTLALTLIATVLSAFFRQALLAPLFRGFQVLRQDSVGRVQNVPDSSEDYISLLSGAFKAHSSVSSEDEFFSLTPEHMPEPIGKSSCDRVRGRAPASFIRGRDS
jgi:hypothetical protein